MDVNKILISNEARVNFLKGLMRIAKSDGVTDEKELVFYNQAAHELGLSLEDIQMLDKTWLSNETIEVNFERNEEKMFFFIQAFQLCWIDGDFTEEERTEIFKIASELSISEEAIKKVSDWVNEGIAWNLRGEELLSYK